MRAVAASLFFLLAGCIYGRSAEEPASQPRRLHATDLVPSGAQWIVYGDVTRFRGTAFARTLERLSTQDDELVPRLRRAEIDLVRDVDRLLVAGEFVNETGVALLEHRMSRDRVESLIEALLTIDGATITREVVGGRQVRRTDDPPITAVIVHEELVAFATTRAAPALFRDLDDRERQLDPLARRFRRALEEPPTSHPPFLVAVAQDTPPLPDVDDVMPRLPPPGALAVWASLHEGLEVHVVGRYPRAEEARQIGGQLDELLELEGRVRAMATLMGLEPLFAGARVEVDGQEVTIRIRVSGRDLEGMLARAELLVAE